MKARSIITGLLMSACVLGSISAAQAEDHINLGRTILLEHGNHGAKIPLLVCRKANAIKIKAERNVRLNRVVITFQNGDKKTISFYRDLKKDETTNWRAFAYKRCVKHIEVFGNSDGSKAGIKVLGRTSK